MKFFLISFTVLMMLIVPTFSYAQAPNPDAGLVPCGKPATAVTMVSGKTYQIGQVIPCDFNSFMKLIDNIMKFILFSLAVPIAALMFAYAGFKLVTSGGSAEAKTRAKTIFFHAVLGIVIAAGAWLIVKTILDILGYDGKWIGF